MLQDKMTFNLDNYSNELDRLCAAYGVRRLELFGSGARRDFDLQQSDLDFLVAFEDAGAEGAFDRFFGFKEALESLFQRPVDLVEAKAIKNPYFRKSIIQDKRPVYGL